MSCKSMLCFLKVDLDLAGSSGRCFLPQLHEDHLTLQFQGRMFPCCFWHVDETKALSSEHKTTNNGDVLIPE